jgi:hypothetical protein
VSLTNAAWLLLLLMLLLLLTMNASVPAVAGGHKRYLHVWYMQAQVMQTL